MTRPEGSSESKSLILSKEEPGASAGPIGRSHRDDNKRLDQNLDRMDQRYMDQDEKSVEMKEDRRRGRQSEVLPGQGHLQKDVW